MYCPKLFWHLHYFLKSLGLHISQNPCVPTGIKIGVGMSPWSVDIRPARAREFCSVCCKSKNTIGILN